MVLRIEDRKMETNFTRLRKNGNNYRETSTRRVKEEKLNPGNLRLLEQTEDVYGGDTRNWVKYRLETITLNEGERILRSATRTLFKYAKKRLVLTFHEYTNRRAPR